MEADWELELGGDAPVIDAHWSGLVDLRSAPERAAELPEAMQQPGLAEALKKLNGAGSPVWTAKCDAWPVAEFDVDELDAPRDAAWSAVACYIDLLSSDPDAWSALADAEAWCKTACARLRAVPMRCCRVDLVVRRAVLRAGCEALGVTAYLTACGATDETAAESLRASLTAFADAIAP